MTVHLLAASDVAILRAEVLTYPEVGRTRTTLPPGYRLLTRMRSLPAGTSWSQATRDLLSWAVPDRAGLRVQASSSRIETGSVGVLSAGPLRPGGGRLAVRAPVRVVYVDRSEHRCAFAYGTLPGHPEAGEEAFVLERDTEGRIVFTITAFSNPATRLTRMAGPVGRAVQTAATLRYLRSL